MALVVTANLTTLNAAESTSTTNGNKPALDPDIKKEGNNSMSFTVTNQDKYAGLTFSSTDLSNQHVRIWYTSILGAYMKTKALGGMAFYVSDGTNESYWYIHGSDTYQGGWINVVQYLNYTDYPPDANNGTNATLTAITEVGILHDFATSPRNVVNCWVDYARYGNGLTVEGTPSFDMDDIYIDDDSNGYCIVEKIDGVYFLSGAIIIGDSTGTDQTIYDEANSVLVFTDKAVSSTLYKIQAIGNATGDTDLTFKNCVITSAGPLFDLDFDDPAVEGVDITGCQISGADETLLDTNCTVKNTVFNDCGLITVEAATVEDCTVSNPSGNVALHYPDLVADDNTARITFIDETAGVYAIEISADVDHTFDGHKFTGSWTAHINNNSGQAITVYATNGADPSTYTGTVTIENSVTLTITGLVEGTVVMIVQAGTTTQVAYSTSTGVGATGEFEYTYNYPTGFNVDIFIHKEEYLYQDFLDYTLAASSAELPVNQVNDRQYSNPA